MVQMRALLVLALCVTAQAASDAECAMDGAAAVDEMLDSAVFIWAATQRCDQGVGEAVRCEVNVASAIESINGMVNVIVKAMGRCGAIDTEQHACGIAVGVLTKSVAGLAGASGGIIAQCKIPVLSPTHQGTVAGAMDDASKYGHSKFGACIVDVKDTMKSFFQAVKRLMTVKDSCKDAKSEHCEHNALKIVSAFASMGSFLAGTVDHCSPKPNEDAACAEESLALTHEVQNVGRAAVAMNKACHLSATQRLYLDNEGEEAVAPAANNGVTFGLAALLPITAVLSFVGGSRISKARSTAPRDFESLVQAEE